MRTAYVSFEPWYGGTTVKPFRLDQLEAKKSEFEKKGIEARF